MSWYARYSEAQTVSPQRALKMAGPQPFIPDGYDLYLDFFFKLNSERLNGDGRLGSIPVLKMIEYANWIDIRNVNEFIEVIIRIDAVYVDAINKQLRKQMQ